MSTFSISQDEADAPSNDAKARLFDTARQIREFQEAQLPKLSDGSLLSKFPQLGSTKTFKRFLNEDDSEMKDIESKWLPKYEEVVRLIEAERNSSAEPTYADLPLLQPVLADATRLMNAVGIKRLMIIEGDTGHGKSFALRAIKKKFGERAVLCEADESWFRGASAIGQLALASGAVDTEAAVPRRLSAIINLVVSHLKGRRLVLIDEIHHCGGQALNILKSLINKTDSVFVVAGMKTLLDKLSHAAAQEARQLTHNRLFARHTFTGPAVADAQMFFSRRLDLDASDKTLDQAIAALISHKNGGSKPELVAAHLGGMAFLRNVADECRNLVGKEKVDAKTLIAAANLVKKQATGR